MERLKVLILSDDNASEELKNYVNRQIELESKLR